MYHEFPERIRMGYDNVMLPFVWSDRNKVRWCQDEWFCERVIELFTFREREIILFDVVRSYEELLEKIEREKVSNIVDLPCYEDSAEINDDNVDNYIECLPVFRRGVLVVNDFEIERLKYSRAVSYTHLDVYKRQEKPCTIRSYFTSLFWYCAL